MRIALGTAQFGQAYGITNADGRITRPAGERIVADALSAGVDTIDTACLYGDSEAELGAIGVGAFRIVTKTAKYAGMAKGEACADLRARFETSLERLCVDRVHGLLLHDAADLLGPSGDTLWHALNELRAEGLVAKIGVSAYEGMEIDLALDRYPLGIVQLPFNPLDRRLVEGGQLERLAKAGVEVHARSLFLQGLLLMERDRLPPRFAMLGTGIDALDRAARTANADRLGAILAIAFQRREITRFVCGVASVAEWRQLLATAPVAESMRNRIAFAMQRPLDPAVLNPARWHELADKRPTD